MGFGFKRKVGSGDCSFSDIRLAPFIIGVILVVVGLVDMLILYFVPYSIIKKNKKKYPNEAFEKPNNSIIVIHFILHSVIIFFGIILILIGFEVDLCEEFIWIIILSILVVVLYIVEIALGFKFTRYPKSEMTVQHLYDILSADPPSNQIFIYTSDTITRRSCSGTGRKRKCHTNTYNCYSKSGISFPITSKLIRETYSFDEAPSLFYIKVSQKVNMSRDLTHIYSNIFTSLSRCDSSKKAVEHYPLIAAEYIVSNKKIPVGLSKGTRIASIVLGVGAYYELYSKSVPHLNFTQRFDADVVTSFDYNAVWKGINCERYGKCSTSNSRPKP